MPIRPRQYARDLLARAKHHVRQWRAVYLPDRHQQAYERWAAQQSAQRQSSYIRDPEPGLLSILTAVWERSPAGYLRELADSIAVQNGSGACEWVLVDNGCGSGAIREELARLASFAWVRLVRLDQNAGIVGGLRAGLEAAGGRYTMSVDGDDLLYPDALRTVAHYIITNDYPALLYSDEDKTNGGHRFEAYLKPDWDPVLMLNSPYVAHLGVVDRRKALQLAAYTDKNTEGSADWDLFMRFMIAGYDATHIPEVLYSWRIHGGSTAGDIANKSYIHTSQRAVLQRFVDSRPEPKRYLVTESPLFPGAPHFRISKSSAATHRTLEIVIERPDETATNLADSVVRARATDSWIHLRETGLQVTHSDWLAEAEALFELHPDAVMLGGLIVDQNRRVISSGLVFGFHGVCGDPYRDHLNNPGYFGELRKRRSVSAVTTRFAIVKPAFLDDVLRSSLGKATVGFLGAWAGAHAMRSGKRVIYSPFLGGILRQPWTTGPTEEELRLFEASNRDLIPDTRFYSPHFSRTKPFRVET